MVNDATICGQSKIIIPMDPMISIEMKECSYIPYLSQLLKMIVHGACFARTASVLDIFDFSYTVRAPKVPPKAYQFLRNWCDTMLTR